MANGGLESRARQAAGWNEANQIPFPCGEQMANLAHTVPYRQLGRDFLRILEILDVGGLADPRRAGLDLSMLHWKATRCGTEAPEGGGDCSHMSATRRLPRFGGSIDCQRHGEVGCILQASRVTLCRELMMRERVRGPEVRRDKLAGDFRRGSGSVHNVM